MSHVKKYVLRCKIITLYPCSCDRHRRLWNVNETVWRVITLASNRYEFSNTLKLTFFSQTPLHCTYSHKKCVLATTMTCRWYFYISISSYAQDWRLLQFHISMDTKGPCSLHNISFSCLCLATLLVVMVNNAISQPTKMAEKWTVNALSFCAVNNLRYHNHCPSLLGRCQ